MGKETGKETIKVVSRASKLARVQTENVLARLKGFVASGQAAAAQDASKNRAERLAKRFRAGIETSHLCVKTTADIHVKQSFQQLADSGTVGFFTKEVDEALLAGRADFAVHSLKDLPAELPKGLKLLAVTKRESYHDLLLTCKPYTLEDLLARGKPVVLGSSSLRRSVFLKKKYPSLQARELRGNIETRLKKLQNKEVDALVLAESGLQRLQCNFEERSLLAKRIALDVLLPAPGQGALAIVGLLHPISQSQDSSAKNKNEAARLKDIRHLLVLALNDEYSRLCCHAERMFMKAIEGGCRMPLSALAELRFDEKLEFPAKATTKQEAAGLGLRGAVKIQVQGSNINKARVARLSVFKQFSADGLSLQQAVSAAGRKAASLLRRRLNR